MGADKRTHNPAAQYDWALPLYDPVVKLLGFEGARRALLDQAKIGAAHRVLDIGCGTGTLALEIKSLHPDVAVTGLDPDPKALARSRRKAVRAGLSIRFDEGFSDRLPYADASFDRVLSSFMFHHLRTEDRERTLREVARVLQDGGSFHLLDFMAVEAGGRPSLIRLFHSSRELQDNVEHRILALMNRGGLRDAAKVAERSVVYGLMRIGYYRGSAAR
jgi:ubiquinone/menaquinone biosynthesis C-methylase UbiE